MLRRRHNDNQTTLFCPTKVIDADRVIQSYQSIAEGWIKMRNYPYAIVVHRKLIETVPHYSFAVAEVLYQIGLVYQQAGQFEWAIIGYDDFFERAAGSGWRDEAIYNQAVCYYTTRAFRDAYRGFRGYMSLGPTREYYHEAEGYVRQMERDQDEDG